MSFLSEDERIKQRIHYFGYQAFWITFWLLITGGLIFHRFFDKKLIGLEFILSIAISGLYFFLIRTICDGIDLLKFKSGIGSSPKKLLYFIILGPLGGILFNFTLDPEVVKNNPFRKIITSILGCLTVVGFLYLGQKFIDWRNKKALGSEKDDIKS